MIILIYFIFHFRLLLISPLARRNLSCLYPIFLNLFRFKFTITTFINIFYLFLRNTARTFLLLGYFDRIDGFTLRGAHINWLLSRTNSIITFLNLENWATERVKLKTIIVFLFFIDITPTFLTDYNILPQTIPIPRSLLFLAIFPISFHRRIEKW